MVCLDEGRDSMNWDEWSGMIRLYGLDDYRGYILVDEKTWINHYQRYFEFVVISSVAAEPNLG